MISSSLLAKYRLIIVLLLTSMFIAGFSGCTSQSSSSIPVICTPNPSNVNIYRVTPQPSVNMIFEHAFPSIPSAVSPTDQQILDARYAAFQYLITETKRWSDTETIKLADLTKVRITLTFISSELFQAIFLNEVLKNRYPTSGFQDQLQSALNAVGARDELLFLLTVTATNNNVNSIHHTIKIQLDNMIMNNAENLQVSPSHDDHNLEQLIDTSSEPVFGYLAYPFAILSGSQCEWILDPKYNTSIVITTSSIEIDGVSNNSQYSWTIPYTPLINSVMPSSVNISTLPLGFDQTLYPMTPLTLPPVDINQANYWQNFARFIWGQFTLGNY